MTWSSLLQTTKRKTSQESVKCPFQCFKDWVPPSFSRHHRLHGKFWSQPMFSAWPAAESTRISIKLKLSEASVAALNSFWNPAQFLIWYWGLGNYCVFRAQTWVRKSRLNQSREQQSTPSEGMVQVLGGRAFSFCCFILSLLIRRVTNFLFVSRKLAQLFLAQTKGARLHDTWGSRVSKCDSVAEPLELHQSRREIYGSPRVRMTMICNGDDQILLNNRHCDNKYLLGVPCILSQRV